jgi:hypothetical protein
MDCWSRNVNTTHSHESLFSSLSLSLSPCFFFLFVYLFHVPFRRVREHSDARTTISPRTFQRQWLKQQQQQQQQQRWRWWWWLRDGMQTLDRVRWGGCAFSELSPPTSPSCQATDSFHSAHT